MIQSAKTERKHVRCAIYARKSSEDGLDMEFNSLDAQREACEAYIASQRHDGWVALPKAYVDGGFTGGNTDRPALQRLLVDIEAGKVDVVTCYKLDRLSRSLVDFVRLMALFEKHGAALVSTTQKFDTSSSMGRLMLNVLMSFAEFERQVIGERIRDKLAAAKRKGKYTGGRPPLGYDVDRRAMRLVVNPEEAKIVRFIFERFLKIGSGMRVAQELNAKGCGTKAWTTRKGQPHGGEKWNKVYVYLILNNRRYLGEVVHQGQAYRGEHEALIDRATWDKVQAILSTSRARRGAQTRRKTVAMLKGLVKCGHCGKAMGDTYTRKKGRVYRYFVCTSAEKIGYASCPVRSVPAGEIEGAVLQYLKNIFRSPEVIARTVQAMHRQVRQERADLAREQQTLDQRLAEVRKMIRNLVEAGGQASGGALADELRRLNEEYAAAEHRLADVDGELAAIAEMPEEHEVVAALRNIDPLWDDLFPAEKHRIAQLLVDQVVVNAKGLTIRLRATGLRNLVSEVNATTAKAEERSRN